MLMMGQEGRETDLVAPWWAPPGVYDRLIDFATRARQVLTAPGTACLARVLCRVDVLVQFPIIGRHGNEACYDLCRPAFYFNEVDHLGTCDAFVDLHQPGMDSLCTCTKAPHPHKEVRLRYYCCTTTTAHHH